MNKTHFLFEDKIRQIHSSFVKDGWVTVYESIHADDDQCLIYCCLFDKSIAAEYRKDRDWRIGPGREGKPCIIIDYENGKEETKYLTYADEGIEPFIFSKRFSFQNMQESYIDISEEFVMYFKLYEKVANKQNRKYYFIDEVGDLEEVIIIEPGKVRVKLKYLIEYISVRKIYFSICFDFMRFTSASFKDLEIQPLDEDYQSDSFFYNHFIRSVAFVVNKVQSWIMGKVFLNPKDNIIPYYNRDSKYEDFITGYTDDGSYLYESCKKSNENYFKVTYFKKEVLNKYYNDPTMYTVDGWSVQSNFFHLKIDNNLENYVAVFLNELRMLPHKEQLHWKQYNISPQKGISHTYYKTMIDGSWAEHPETVDLYFKYKYEDFNKKWMKEFGWFFYKPLAVEDEYNFTALHVPTTNNVKAFCEQVLSIVKITIDRLNEEEFRKHIVLEEYEQGISKLEKFLKVKGVELPDMMEFMRNLQNLRSGLIAHSFSTTNKKCKKAMEYFGLTRDNYIEVAKEIFLKSIYTMNTLEKILLEKNV